MCLAGKPDGICNKKNSQVPATKTSIHGTTLWSCRTQGSQKSSVTEFSTTSASLKIMVTVRNILQKNSVTPSPVPNRGMGTVLRRSGIFPHWVGICSAAEGQEEEIESLSDNYSLITQEKHKSADVNRMEPPSSPQCPKIQISEWFKWKKLNEKQMNRKLWKFNGCQSRLLSIRFAC